MDSLLATLRDPAARTILAVLAVCVTVSLFLWTQRQRRKALTYSVEETRVLSVHEEVKGRIQILFDGAPANDVSIIKIKVKNTGGEPIRASDFDRVLRFQWEKSARILLAEVASTKPLNLRPAVTAGVSEFVLEPLLLNRGDWIEIKVLVSPGGAFSIDGRVVGIPQIKKQENVDSVVKRLFIFASVLAVLLVLILAGEGFRIVTPNGPLERRLEVLAPAATLVFLVWLLKTQVEELLDYYKTREK
jgi:hypothetical protein